ncbi:hypothetical protein N0V95_009752 [Ascochyta clinopodiicola]|nr:hypothetical protein N0V95_009752 [Ascochyta clinopodiicola]
MDRDPRRPKQRHDMSRLQQQPCRPGQPQYLDSQADGEDGVNAAQTAQGCSEWTNGHGYLSADGVPFDLREGNTQGQGDLETAGPNNDGRPIYTGPRSGSYKAFYGAYKPLDGDSVSTPESYHEHRPIYTGPQPGSYKAFYGTYKPPDKEPVSSGRPPFDAQKAAVDSASKNLLYYGDNTDEEKPKTALVRYSPEPSIPRARMYRGRKEDEYLQWDEQYGFGFAVSPPRNQSLRAPKPAAGLTTTSSRTTGRWDNFAARITQDDKMMAEKAREDLRRLEGDTFRPEARETYKDKKGKKETVVYKTVGGSASAGPTKRQGGEKGEKYTGDAGVAVDEAYDSDSSDGGIALSPSDLDPDSWVVIKTGDEHKG